MHVQAAQDWAGTAVLSLNLRELGREPCRRAAEGQGRPTCTGPARIYTFTLPGKNTCSRQGSTVGLASCANEDLCRGDTWWEKDKGPASPVQQPDHLLPMALLPAEEALTPLLEGD